MLLGDRLRLLREAKHLSQADIEERTGLRRCYISRIECGHTVPSLETIEKFARGLEIHVYQFFIGNEEKPDRREIRTIAGRDSAGRHLKTERDVQRFRDLFPRMSESNRFLLLHMAHRMARRKR
ncbi:MAG: helix-turn-helix transcriptional regulator [Candidatus Acidiferrales bacterium]